MGSESDWPIMHEAVRTANSFGANTRVDVLSAQRTPDAAVQAAATAAKRDIKVILAFAGMAALWAGMLAAPAILSVVGVPQKVGALNELDGLLPPVHGRGIPVATVTIEKTGADHAVMEPLSIFALSHPALEQRLAEYKVSFRTKTLEVNEQLQKDLPLT